MIRAVKTTLFNDRADAARRHLELLVGRDDVSKIGKVSEIKLSGKLEKGYIVSNDGSILTLPKTGFDELLHLTAPANKDGGENHLEEKQDYCVDFTPYENHIYKALNNVRDFFKRALGRTTGMFSRLLKLVIDSVGYRFDKGTLESVFSRIEKDTFNNPTFIRDFSKYFFKSNNISSSATVDIPEPTDPTDPTIPIVDPVFPIIPIGPPGIPPPTIPTDPPTGVCLDQPNGPFGIGWTGEIRSDSEIPG